MKDGDGETRVRSPTAEGALGAAAGRQIRGEKSRKGKLTVLKMQSPDEAVMYFPGEGKTSMGCKEALQITMNIWSYKYEWVRKEKRNVYGRFRSSEKRSIPPLLKHPGEGVWGGTTLMMLIFLSLLVFPNLVGQTVRP